jgi:hypothetical protein
MQISIDISDKDLRSIVDAQVGKALAAVTEQVIKEKAEEILNLKLARLDVGATVGNLVSQEITNKVDEAVNGALGSPHYRAETIKKLVQNAAIELLKQSISK